MESMLGGSCVYLRFKLLLLHAGNKSVRTSYRAFVAADTVVTIVLGRGLALADAPFQGLNNERQLDQGNYNPRRRVGICIQI